MGRLGAWCSSSLGLRCRGAGQGFGRGGRVGLGRLFGALAPWHLPSPRVLCDGCCCWFSLRVVVVGDGADTSPRIRRTGLASATIRDACSSCPLRRGRGGGR